MPSIEHNGLVEMFRGNPELAATFLARSHRAVRRPATLDRWLDRALGATTVDDLFD